MINNIYTKEVSSKEKLLEELARQSGKIYLEGEIFFIVILKTEEERINYVKYIRNHSGDIFVDGPMFFVSKDWNEEEENYSVIYVQGHLESALRFLINRVIE
jgi:hypothetical protein